MDEMSLHLDLSNLNMWKWGGGVRGRRNSLDRNFRTCMKCRVLKREKRAPRQKGVVAAKQNTLECFQSSAGEVI